MARLPYSYETAICGTSDSIRTPIQEEAVFPLDNLTMGYIAAAPWQHVDSVEFSGRSLAGRAFLPGRPASSGIDSGKRAPPRISCSLARGEWPRSRQAAALWAMAGASSDTRPPATGRSLPLTDGCAIIRARIEKEWGLKIQISELRFQNSSLGYQVLNLMPRASKLRPQTSGPTDF